MFDQHDYYSHQEIFPPGRQISPLCSELQKRYPNTKRSSQICPSPKWMSKPSSVFRYVPLVHSKPAPQHNTQMHGRTASDGYYIHARVEMVPASRSPGGAVTYDRFLFLCAILEALPHPSSPRMARREVVSKGFWGGEGGGGGFVEAIANTHKAPTGRRLSACCLAHQLCIHNTPRPLGRADQRPLAKLAGEDGPCHGRRKGHRPDDLRGLRHQWRQGLRLLAGRKGLREGCGGAHRPRYVGTCGQPGFTRENRTRVSFLRRLGATRSLYPSANALPREILRRERHRPSGGPTVPRRMQVPRRRVDQARGRARPTRPGQQLRCGLGRVL